jgi:reactive intermediate/imine deaminase
MSDMLFHMIAAGPKPVAPFSHAVETGRFVFVTGQMPDSPEAPGVLPEGVEAQTRAVMRNLSLILGGIGLDLSHTVMARIYLTEFARDYAALNAIWPSFFAPGRLPARTTVELTGLAYNALVEIDVVARRVRSDRRPRSVTKRPAGGRLGAHAMAGPSSMGATCGPGGQDHPVCGLKRPLHFCVPTPERSVQCRVPRSSTSPPVSVPS